jgi:hypothetical protein
MNIKINGRVGLNISKRTALPTIQSLTSCDTERPIDMDQSPAAPYFGILQLDMTSELFFHGYFLPQICEICSRMEDANWMQDSSAFNCGTGKSAARSMSTKYNCI